MEKRIVIVQRTLLEALLFDGASFLMLAACIWLSKGSWIWSSFMVVVFLFWFCSRVTRLFDKNTHRFANIHELRDWANKQ